MIHVNDMERNINVPLGQLEDTPGIQLLDDLSEHEIADDSKTVQIGVDLAQDEEEVHPTAQEVIMNEMGQETPHEDEGSTHHADPAGAPEAGELESLPENVLSRQPGHLPRLQQNCHHRYNENEYLMLLKHQVQEQISAPVVHATMVHYSMKAWLKKFNNKSEDTIGKKLLQLHP